MLDVFETGVSHARSVGQRPQADSEIGAPICRFTVPSRVSGNVEAANEIETELPGAWDFHLNPARLPLAFPHTLCVGK